MAKRKKKDHKHKIKGKGHTGGKRELGAGRHDHKDPRGGRVKPAGDDKKHTHLDKKKKRTGPPVAIRQSAQKKRPEIKEIGV